MGDFRKLLKDIQLVQEETTSGDIATVDTKLEMKPIKRPKGKKCKIHKRMNCKECLEEDSKWN
jgi:hypothetical protein